MTDPGRLDTENTRRIDKMRATFERLRTERIRAESEVERLERELDEARKEARTLFGTDDDAVIQDEIDAAMARNEQALDAFERLLKDVEARLRGLEDGRDRT
jgi:chromosome segregation ATPase